MECDVCTFTVYFDDPFWVGLYERWEGADYSVCKLTFGAEPRDCEVYQLLLACWRELAFSPALPGGGAKLSRPNPKRARREAARQLTRAPVGTKAQEALKLQYQEGKTIRKEKSRSEREAEEERQFQLRQEKKRKKHRGH